jgi:hypothetical protein
MSTNRSHLQLPPAQVAEFCQRHHIRKLAVFGSALHGDARPDSDLDVLVEFEAGHVPGLFRLAGMELELSALLGGRKVDLNTPLCLSRFFRDEVMFRCTIIWEKIIVIIWENSFQARESVSAWPQSPPMCAARMRRSGIWEVEQRLLRALAGGASACITRCGFAS